MFNLTLKSPLDQSTSDTTPVTNPNPTTPPQVPLSSTASTTSVLVENASDFTTPTQADPSVLQNSPAPPPSTPAEPDPAEKTLEEIAASLTPSNPPETESPPINPPSSATPTSNPTPAPEIITNPADIKSVEMVPPNQDETPSVPVDNPPSELKPQESTDPSSPDPIKALAFLMAEKEIISQNQVKDVIAHLTLPEVKNLLGETGGTNSSPEIPVNYNGTTITIPLTEIINFLSGKIPVISVNKAN